MALYREKRGYIAEVVERWNPHSRTRKDLLGVIDIVAVGRGEILGIQATSWSNVSARVSKSESEPKLREWLRAGGGFVVIGWKRKSGSRAWVWRILRARLADGGTFSWSEEVRDERG